MDALEDLLKGVAAGDQVALEELYDCTSRRVFGLVLSILRDRAAAQEATVDLYARVWLQASRFDPSRGRAETWLLTLAHNYAIDKLRSRRRLAGREVPLEPVWEVPDGRPSPEAMSSDADLISKVRVALKGIPEEQRRAIVAAYFGGMSHTEIAEAFGEPLGTIKTRIRSGMAALRRVFADAREDSP